MGETGTTDKELKFTGTKPVMIASALFLGILALATSFFPENLLEFLGDEPGEPGNILALKVAGALFFGFAFLNWMARGNIIGGIYSRPVAAGNFLHFFMGTMILLRNLVTGPLHWVLWILFAGYLAFTAIFGYLLFKNGRACR